SPATRSWSTWMPGSSQGCTGVSREPSRSGRPRSACTFRSRPGSHHDVDGADGPEAAMEIVIRAAIVYVALWALLRGMGKRTLAELGAFELVLLIVIGDMVQQGVTQEDMSVTGALLAVGTMALLVLVTGILTRRSDRANH